MEVSVIKVVSVGGSYFDYIGYGVGNLAADRLWFSRSVPGGRICSSSEASPKDTPSY